VCLFTQIDRLEAFAVRGEPAALEGIKQLQRASLPTSHVYTRCVCRLARNGRPDAFAVCVRSTTHECVTLSMMVFEKSLNRVAVPCVVQRFEESEKITD
jgi:hypothetical protein